jgi:hypothetical protein
MTDQRNLFETAVVDRLKESGFLEVEIRVECLARCDDGYQDEVINAGWHYWNAAIAANPAPPPNVDVDVDVEWYRNPNWKSNNVELELALDAFWNVAYQQGHEQRGHDDKDGTAQKADDHLRSIIAELCARNTKLQRLFDQQWKRSREAGELWRQAHPGNDDVSPDLGELLTWLMSRADQPAPHGNLKLDQATIERVAAAIDGTDFGFNMSLTRLVDGVSTYTLTMDGKTEEFGDTDDLYARVRVMKQRKQAEAIIAALSNALTQSARWTPPSEADRPEGYECLVTLPVRWVRCFSGRGFVWEPTDPRLRIEALAHGWAPPPTANLEGLADE